MPASLHPTIITGFHLTMSLPPNIHNEVPSVPRNQTEVLVLMYTDSFRAFRDTDLKRHQHLS